MQDLKKMISELHYDFLINRGLKVVSMQIKSSFEKSMHTYITAIKNESEIDKACIGYHEIKKEDYSLTFMHFSDSQINKDFFTHLLCTYPQHQKNIFKNNYYYLSSSSLLLGFDKDCKYFIDEMAKHNVDSIKVLLNFTVSVLPIKKVDVTFLDNCLKEIGIKDKELYNFWLSFLQPRKAQLQNLDEGSKVSNFLMNKYHDEETLKPFFPFFPFLKSQFQDLELDVFDDQTKYTTSALVNYRKLSRLLCIKGWIEENYENACKIFAQALGVHYKFKDPRVYVENRAKRTLRICVFHDSEKFNESNLKKDIQLFFNYLKSNTGFELTTENIQKWFIYQQLKDNVPENSNSKPHSKNKL